MNIRYPIYEGVYRILTLKRAINKFRRKQLKLDKVTRHNHFGGYWA